MYTFEEYVYTYHEYSISQVREKVFCDEIFIGCVWLDEESNTYFVLDSQRSYVYKGFATKSFACEFLDLRASIEGLHPEILIDFDYIVDSQNVQEEENR